MLKFAVLMLFSCMSFAGVKDLSLKLVEGNVTVGQARTDQVRTKSALDKFQGGYDWNFYTNYKYEDSYLSQLFAFMVQQTKSQTFEYGVNKKLKWGADFSVGQRFVQYDLTNWTGSNAALLPSRKPYEVRHIFSYKQELLQDWFGKSYSFDNQYQEASQSLAKLTLDFQTENQLFVLASNYISAKHQNTLLELNKEALRRAEKREQFVKQRVREGLGLMVESYQAEMAKIKQEEMIEQNAQKLTQLLDDLNELISDNVPLSEISAYQLNSPLKYSSTTIDFNQNQELAMVESNIQMTKLALDKAKLILMPSLSLKISQTNNAIQGQFNDSFNNALPGKTNRLQTVELNLTVPLGNTIANAEVDTKRADMQFQRFKLDQTKKRLEVSRKNLEIEQEVLMKNLTFVKRRLDLAQKALNEQNRLYSLGKIDLDTLIRSEEELISTQMAYAGYMMNWDVIQASLYKLAGKVGSFLDQYSE